MVELLPRKGKALSSSLNIVKKTKEIFFKKMIAAFCDDKALHAQAGKLKNAKKYKVRPGTGSSCL
jgi:hypothetical protein